VNLVGGAARNALWREILADLLGCPVTPLAEPESAALGAALQALWTWRLSTGEDVQAHEVAEPFIAAGGPATEPDAERCARYAELGQRFRDEVRARYGDV
jgi:sugar (pentulose or hexulose) kinase